MLERKWTQTTDELQTTNGVLEIWDGGSRRYERWPDGTEYCWEVIGRDNLANGLIETLKELPSWDTPAVTMWHETIPVYIPEGNNEFQIPGWSVTYTQIPEPKEPQRSDSSEIPRQRPPLRQHNQPENAAKQNVNRRHFHHKKPHMGSGPRHTLDNK